MFPSFRHSKSHPLSRAFQEVRIVCPQTLKA